MHVIIREKVLQNVLINFFMNQTMLFHPFWDTVQDLWQSEVQRANKSDSCGDAPASKVCPYPFSCRLKVIQTMTAEHLFLL